MTVPLAGWVKLLMLSVSPLASLSLASTLIVTAVAAAWWRDIGHGRRRTVRCRCERPLTEYFPTPAVVVTPIE